MSKGLLAMVLTFACGLLVSEALRVGKGGLSPSGGKGCQVIIKPEEMEYKYKPKGSPLEFAYLHGDPSKRGPYVFRVRVPPNLLQPPHFHPKDEFGLVISGKFYAGNGSKVDPNIEPLPVGTFVYIPKGCRHYAFTKGEGAVIEVRGEGPWEMLMVDGNGKPTGEKMTLPPRIP